MNLQELKEKLDEAKDEKARAEERLKTLKEQKEELEVELKKYGIKGIKEIDKRTEELQSELELLFDKLNSVEKDVLLTEEAESDIDKEIASIIDEKKDDDLDDDLDNVLDDIL